MHQLYDCSLGTSCVFFFFPFSVFFQPLTLPSFPFLFIYVSVRGDEKRIKFRLKGEDKND